MKEGRVEWEGGLNVCTLRWDADQRDAERLDGWSGPYPRQLPAATLQETKRSSSFMQQKRESKGTVVTRLIMCGRGESGEGG